MAFDNFKKIVTEVVQLSINGKITYPDATTQTTAFNGYSAGQFSDYTTQTTADTTTPLAVTFNTTDYTNGVSVVSSSRITYTVGGTYVFEFDAQVENSAATRSDVYFWIRKNGTDVAGSTAVGSVQAIQTAVNGHTYLGATHLITVVAGDYIQLMWGTTATTTQLPTYTAGTSPTRPTAASVSVYTSLVK